MSDRDVPDLTIRLARPDEHEAIGALTVDGYEADGHLTRPDGRHADDYAAWIRRADERARDGQLLVAVDDHDTLLGTVTWCPPGSPFREVATSDRQGEFRTLAVAPAVRGRGVARALVTACLASARAGGLAEVVLCSLPTMTAAHGLYESLDFVRRPDLDWTVDDGTPLWGYALRLDE